MTSLRRALCLLPMLGLLAGCGFHPIYGTHDGANSDSPVALDLNNVSIDNIPDRDGQMLRNNLIDRMYGPNRPEHPQYHLSVKVHFNEEDIGILADATSTRTLLNMYGDYVLTDAHGGEILHGEAHSVTSYNRLDQMYGTVAAQQDAHQRTIHEVGEQIVNRVSLYFSERK